ncbi:MAG: DUF2750 domain-containing protein, partial [Verrucomicrobia bacterium]|nr:DUF2750 domain-containing protein [Verrucomicrobiota bacterium]
AADGKRRYTYFVGRVCETRKVWSLYQDGWASFGVGDQQLLPLWPHRAYAEPFRHGNWATYEPAEIDLDEFLAEWIPRLQHSGLAPAVFPTPAGHAVVVTPDDLAATLRQELADSCGEE